MNHSFSKHWLNIAIVYRGSLRTTSSRHWAGSSAGITLIELLIAISVLSILMLTFCEIYLAIQKEFSMEIEHAQSLDAARTASQEIGKYIMDAMEVKVFSRFSSNDTIAVCLPADTAYGIYVPTSNPSWGWHPGVNRVFYLSNATGSYAARGDILWSGTYSSWGSTPSSTSVTPDTSWSLYPGTTKPRITPISSIEASIRPRNYSNIYTRVDYTVTSSYSDGRSIPRTVSISNSACPRSIDFDK